MVDDFTNPKLTYEAAAERYRDLTRRIASTGFLVLTPQGVVRNPLLAERAALVRQMDEAATEAGILVD